MSAYLTAVSNYYLKYYSGFSLLCWKSIILYFIESTLIGIYYFLPLYFIIDLHLSVSIAGSIISLYGIGTIIGGFLGGKCSDRFSPSLVSVFSLVLQTIIFLFLVKLTAPVWLGINLFFMGIASYGFITANTLVVLAQCKDNEKLQLQGISVLNIASNLGFGLSAVIVGIFADSSFKYFLEVVPSCLFLTTIYAYLIHQSFHKLLNVPIYKKEIKPKINSLMQMNKTVFLIWCCLFLVGLIIFQLNTTYSIYIKESFSELGIKAVSMMFIINCFLVVFFQAPIVNVFVRMDKLYQAGLGAFLIGFGMFMLVSPFHLSWVLLATIIYTIGEILFFPVAQLICYQAGNESNKGKMMGIYRVVYAASRVAAPLGGGYIYQRMGGKILWLICGIIGTFCLSVCCYQKLVSKAN